MNAAVASDALAPSAMAGIVAVSQRADELCAQRLDQERRATDRIFLGLLLAQWVFAILLAVKFSPYAWEGRQSTVHIHVHIAVLFGGLVNALPIALILLRPAQSRTIGQ